MQKFYLRRNKRKWKCLKWLKMSLMEYKPENTLMVWKDINVQ